jgi:transposase-like protein
MARGQIRKYSGELKQRAVEEIENGKMSMAEARHEYGLNKASLHSWLKEYKR